MNERNSNVKIKYLRIFCIYAVIMFLLVVLGMAVVGRRTETYTPNQDPPQSSTQTEYIYVTLGESEQPDKETDPPTVTVYTVREHMGKIGVFSDDGTLIRVIDVYVKTLPESDRRMLKEGFEVIGKTQLNKIVEDYDG